MGLKGVNIEVGRLMAGVTQPLQSVHWNTPKLFLKDSTNFLQE